MTGTLLIAPEITFQVEVPHFGYPNLPSLHVLFLQYGASPIEYALAQKLKLGNRESGTAPELSVFLDVLSVLKPPRSLTRVRTLMRGLFPRAPAPHMDQLVVVANNRISEEATRAHRQACIFEGLSGGTPSAASFQRAVEKNREVPKREGAE